MADRFVDADSAALYLGLKGGRRAIYRLAKADLIKTYWVGGLKRFHLTNLRDYVMSGVGLGKKRKKR